MKKILVPLDFSEHSKVAYQFALAMAEKMDASPTLFYAIQKPSDESEKTLEYGHTKENILHAWQRELHRFVEKNTPSPSGHPDFQIEIKTEIAPPAEGILKAAADLPAELVIMGMRNKNFWDDFLFGSVTEGVLKKIDRPILVVPPKYKYQPPDQLLYLFHYGYSSLKNLQILGEWAENWNATSHCALIAGQDTGQKELEEIKEKINATCTNVHQASFSLGTQQSDFRKELSAYIEQHGITILAMEHHDKILQKLMHRVKETGIVRHLHLPVLFLPHKKL